jgi:hypothetical protein
VRDGHAQIFGRRAGFYELWVPGEREPAVTFAANLQSEEESDLAPPKKLVVAGQAAKEVVRAAVVERDLWVYLLLLALAITLVEWLTYHRRVTV